MSDHNSNPLPASKFPKLEEVARRQRRMKRTLTFMALAAIASAMVSLVGCGSDEPPVQSVVDSMNTGDDDLIDPLFTRDAKEQLDRLNQMGGARILIFRLVYAEDDGSHATLAATPEGEPAARYLVDVELSRADGRVERLAYRPVAARW